MTGVLTEQEQAVLQLAESGLRGGLLANAVRELGMTQTGYAAALNALIDTEKALAAYPGLVNRLRRLRASQVSSRRRW